MTLLLPLFYPSRTHLTAGSAWLQRDPDSMYLNQSHLSRLICRALVGKPADAGENDEEKAGGEGCAEGQLGSRRLLISLLVKFMYRLSILFCASLLYARYEVTINSSWHCVKTSPGSATYLLSSSDVGAFTQAEVWFQSLAAAFKLLTNPRSSYSM